MPWKIEVAGGEVNRRRPAGAELDPLPITQVARGLFPEPASRPGI
jgi:hypothetical protein